jgi:hypothetical protein
MRLNDEERAKCVFAGAMGEQRRCVGLRPPEYGMR